MTSPYILRGRPSVSYCPRRLKPPCFILDPGVLYRWVKGKSQVVIPMALCLQVISLAHDPLMAGHLGPEKTLDCIILWFYWPSIHAQVQRYCAECHNCQLHQGKGARGPMQPMPWCPFHSNEWASALWGRSSNPPPNTGYCWSWWITPTTTLKRSPYITKRIAQELAQVFTRVGNPKQVVTNQETSLMSEVHQDVWTFLGVQPLRTSIYHPQTDNLMKRFNGTLKQIL